MASEVGICNLALSHIRAGSINSLDDEGVEGDQCNLKYALMRDIMLSGYNWPFAHGIKPLSLTTTEIFNWAYSYQYPADCLRINRLVGSFEEVSSEASSSLVISADLRQRIPYEVFNLGTRLVGTNLADARISYRQKITDPNLFSPEFTVALSYLLAAELAIPVVGAELGRALRTDSLTLYREYVNSATANAQNEQYAAVPDSEFVTIRS